MSLRFCLARCLAALLAIVAFVAPAAHAQNGFTLPAGCKLPFDSIATKPDPFVSCGNCGAISGSAQASDAQPKILQSQAKNNFCGDTSNITVVDFTALRGMGATAQKNGWEVTDLPSRQPLHGFYSINGESIGEGDVVRLKAWILNAHISDCASGEEVNCETPGFVNNDLHIPLVDPSAGGQKQGECTSVTAEITPHFRPRTWANLDLQTPVKNVVRITGQLFYDNAHKPCASLTSASAPTGDPARSTLWEIHPVYQLEVCTLTNVAQCDVTSSDATMWMPYDQWIASAANQKLTAATGKASRQDPTCANPAPPNSQYQPAACSAVPQNSSSQGRSTQHKKPQPSQ